MGNGRSAKDLDGPLIASGYDFVQRTKREEAREAKNRPGNRRVFQSRSSAEKV
jgi:hypothetical protein